MANIVVLGGGLVGNVIAQDLSEQNTVKAVDKCESTLSKLSNKKNIQTIVADITDTNTLYSIIKDADLVIIALPGFMAFNVLKNVIQAGKNVADISFYPEDAISLNELAKQHQVTVIVDCGIAPGMSNFLLGYHHSKMQVEDFICYVGGLPVERKFPFQYKAPFSPTDVIEEYTRPARIKENGKIVVKPALSEPELLDFENIGTLEAFNTDGLRSLLYTINDIPNMKEKTLRYPGHIELIQALKTIGFLNNQEIKINEKSIKPIELTTHLLKEVWKLNPGEHEFTIMKVIIKGIENEKTITYTYDLFDRYDETTGFTSMSRTTGFTCSAMAHLILEKQFTQKGVFPPELIASSDNTFNFVIDYLKKRNIQYKLTIS